MDKSEQAMATVNQLQSELIIQAEQVAAVSRDLEGKYHAHTAHRNSGTRKLHRNERLKDLCEIDGAPSAAHHGPGSFRSTSTAPCH